MKANVHIVNTQLFHHVVIQFHLVGFLPFFISVHIIQNLIYSLAPFSSQTAALVLTDALLCKPPTTLLAFVVAAF